MSNPVPLTTAGLAIRKETLHRRLDERADHSPDQLAFRFLVDGEEDEQTLTLGELVRLARSEAAGLVAAGVIGKPVLLIRPTGLEFITGLFACWYAGAIAVPAYPPRGGRHKKRLQSILEDSGATIALASENQEPIAGVTIIHRSAANGPDADFPEIDPDDTCLLQYTSGSTSTPKGVMISHTNLSGHFASMLARGDLDFGPMVSWLPPYHDMGLVLKLLYSLERGVPLTFFAPEHFVQRPVRWLRAISRYRADMSGAPNFAYETCLRSIKDEEMEGIDLSCWNRAGCGAERIRAETLDRFAERFSRWGFRYEAFGPGYGMAETTLIVTATHATESPRISEHPKAGKLVSNGTPLPGIDLRIIDIETGRECSEREIGEIRVKGPAVSSGYWNHPQATNAAFSEDGTLHTGDLGFLEDGELYVTGRIKDLIIIDGTNHAPEDVESIVLNAVPEATAVAAFSAEAGGRESIVVAVECDRLSKEVYHHLCSRVRRAVGESLEAPVRRVLLLRQGLIPRTTSGKVRRSACRQAIEADSLQLLFDDEASSHVTAHSALQDSVSMVMEMVAKVTGIRTARPGDDLVELGLHSMDMTRLAALLQEQTGSSISIGDLFASRSISEIAAMIPQHVTNASAFPEVIPGSGLSGNVMTHSQERMWFLHQLEPESAAYHVLGALDLRGPIDRKSLDHAICAVIARHEILCSRHGIEDGTSKVWIASDDIPPIEFQNATDESGVQASLTRFARRPFLLSEESPIRICLVSTGPERHILGICVHHIVADGWSMRILAGEISAAYSAYQSGHAEPLKDKRHSYPDYAVSHRQWVDSGAVDAQIAYWKSRLTGHSGIMQLATDFPRPAKPASVGGAVEMALPPYLCNRVASLAKAHRGTPFMVHLAVFLLVLRRHGAGDDLVVAIPVANRNHAAAADLIGTLVNTLPFRLSLDPREKFVTLLDRVREATFEMQAAQDAPFEKIIDAVKPGRSRDHSPLAQVMFDHQEIPVAGTWSGGLECRPYVAHRGAVQFDLSLLLTVLGDRQQLSIEYRQDLFREETATALLDRYLGTLELICSEPDRELSSIASLTTQDQKQLSLSEQGPVRSTFPLQTTPALIAGRMAKHPQRVAITSGDEALVYADLDKLSDRIAAALQTHGVKHGDRVAALLDRNIHLPAALLAIWKTGAAYVPLDSANPPERLKLILDDQQPIHVLSTTGLLDTLPAGIPAILLEDALAATASPLTDQPTTPADLAYVIYTSGSTGKPKGVEIPHGALANFLLSMAEIPGFTEADKLLAVTTISFDISTLEIFLPLITGGSLDLVTTAIARDGDSLLALLKSSRSTVMQATPATWRLLLDAGWKGTEDLKILCGGEALDLPLAAELVKMGGQLWNMYGPTETTVWSSLWQVPANPTEILIGTPIANTGMHILAPDGSCLPPGVTGELWISGDGLATGYWKRPELTAKNFVSPMNGPRRYKTGDLARWTPDGALECLGRSDDQVKIRGFRVELGEIEAAIAAYPTVAQAKVAFRGPDLASRKLVAWVTLLPGESLGDMSGLRDFLTSHLPVYMLPADIGVIDTFPLGSSGKVDVSTLENPVSKAGITRPLSHTEKKLAAIWSELLGKPTVSSEDDWFHSGGHSLLALRLFSRIRQDFQRSLPLSAILDQSTLMGLAERIDNTATDEIYR